MLWYLGVEGRRGVEDDDEERLAGWMFFRGEEDKGGVQKKRGFCGRQQEHAR